MNGMHLHFVTGLVLGTVLFDGGTALAAGILAEPSTQTFFVDGQNVQMEAYAIAGHNYVQLRDVGRAVDFSVTYDGTTNSVRMDSAAPYTEETPATTPAIFTRDLTREIYNAMRQTVIDKDALLAGDGKGGVFTAATEGTELATQSVAAALGRYPVYAINVQSKNHFSCDVKYPTAYDPRRRAYAEIY